MRLNDDSRPLKVRNLLGEPYNSILGLDVMITGKKMETTHRYWVIYGNNGKENSNCLEKPRDNKPLYR